MVKQKWSKIGSIAFVVGLILAAIIALFNSVAAPTWAIFVLAVLGLIVGLLNVQDSEISLFLLAALTFLLSFQGLSAVFSTLALGWAAVGVFFNLMVVFVAPAAAIVALQALFKLAKD